MSESKKTSVKEINKLLRKALKLKKRRDKIQVIFDIANLLNLEESEHLT